MINKHIKGSTTTQRKPEKKKKTNSKIAVAEHSLKELERTFTHLELRATYFLSMGHQTFILQPIKSTVGAESPFDVH